MSSCETSRSRATRISPHEHAQTERTSEAVRLSFSPLERKKRDGARRRRARATERKGVACRSRVSFSCCIYSVHRTRTHMYAWLMALCFAIWLAKCKMTRCSERFFKGPRAPITVAMQRALAECVYPSNNNPSNFSFPLSLFRPHPHTRARVADAFRLSFYYIYAHAYVAAVVMLLLSRARAWIFKCAFIYIRFIVFFRKCAQAILEDAAVSVCGYRRACERVINEWCGVYNART